MYDLSGSPYAVLGKNFPPSFFSGSLWNLWLSLSSQEVSFLIEALPEMLLQPPPTGITGKTPTGFHRLWMKPWSGTPFPMVLWVKSYCVERGEYVDSWRTDSLLWCLGMDYGHYITSRVFTPSTLGTDVPWPCTAASHLPWSKQVRRNKPESRTSGCWPVPG